MDNQYQHGVGQQNMGCNMNGYPPSPSWFMPPNYIYQQPMQGSIPVQPIPFPGISAPPVYPSPTPVVNPPQHIPDDVVIDLANSVSDDDSSDEPANVNGYETNRISAPTANANERNPNALHEEIETAVQFLRDMYDQPLVLSEYFGLDDSDYSEESEQMEESDDSQIIDIFNDSEEEESPSTREEQVTKAKDNLSQYCCPICMDPPVRPVSTTCGHIYCAKCMRSLFRRPYQEWKCPLCTKHIRKENVHPIFF